MEASTTQPRLLARNFMWLSLQELLIRAAGLVVAIYLARALGPEGYGQLGIALAIISVCSIFVASGTGSWATRLTALDPTSVPDTHRKLTGLRLVLAAVVMALMAGTAPWLGPVIGVPPLLLVLCSLLMLRTALTVFWAFRGIDRMHVNAMAESLEKVLFLLGLIVLIRGGENDLLRVPLIEVGAVLIAIGWARWRLSQPYPGLRVSFRPGDWREILSEALPLGAAQFLGAVFVNSGLLLLGWLADSRAAGEYLVAQKIMLTLLIPMSVLVIGAFPSASRLLRSDQEAAIDLVTRLLRYYLIAVTPLFLIVLFFAESMLALLFGDEYRPAAELLIVLLVAVPLLAVSTTGTMVLRALPKPGGLLLARAVATVILLIASLILIPRQGAVGAAAAVIVAELAAAVILHLMIWLAVRRLPLDLRCLLPVIAGALSAAVFVWLGAHSLLFGLSIAALVYVLVLVLSGGVSLAETRELMSLALHTARAPVDRTSG